MDNVIIAEGDQINGNQLMVVKSAGILQHLNELQSAHADKVRDFWLNYILSCENQTQKEKAAKVIEWLYKFCKKEKPVIIFMDSPFGCQVAANFFKDNIRDNIGDNIGDNIRDNIGANIRDNIWDNIGDNIRDNIGDNKFEYHTSSWYGNVGDYGWVAFIDYFMQLGVIDKSNDFEEFKELLLSGVYDMIQFNGMCIVSDMPTKIVRNINGRLHSLDASAIEFKDGYCQYYVNGVHISPSLFDSLLNKKYSLSDFISEKNEETKAAILFFMREKWGEDYLVNLFTEHLKEIDTYVDKKKPEYLQGTNEGMNIGVYTLFKGNFGGIAIAYVRCYCPSTDRMFYLGVDPVQINAKDAIASLYRIPSCLKGHIKEIRRQGERYSTTLTDRGNEILKKLTKSEAEDLTPITGEEYFSKMTYEY